MTPKAERTLGKARKVGDEVALEALTASPMKRRSN